MVNALAIEVNHSSSTPSECTGGVALSCTGVVKRFGQVVALSGLDLAVESGQILALLGPSGCGKTTALRLIAGFDRPDEGEISVAGRVVSSEGVVVPPEKRRIGMVFQEGALFPHLTVEQNVGYGLRKDLDRSQRIDQVLELIGLTQMRHRLPHEMSGGQQQRVALGRALAPSPDILLLDEPFSNLDAKLREQLQQDVVSILHASSVTAVFVTHDQQAALTVGDKVAVMNEGRLEQSGSPSVVFHAPRTRFVANFVGAVDFLPVEMRDGHLASELGELEEFHEADQHHERTEGSASLGECSISGCDMELMVRPDCVECVFDEEGKGIVISREFQGPFYMYHVRMPSGREVRSLMSHIAEFPVGTRVTPQLRQGHRIRLFVDGTLADVAIRNS